MKTIGQILRSTREKKKWSQSDLAGGLGWSVQYLSNLENDSRPPPKYDVMLEVVMKLKLDVKEVFESCAYSLRKRRN